MRPEVEFIVPDVGRDWTFRTRSADAFGFAWHAHDEFELTIIAEGSGRRFAGDGAAPYRAGDLALFGPRVPHTYASDAGPNTAYIAHFSPSFVHGWCAATEFRAVQGLLDRAARGVAVPRPGAALQRTVDALIRARGPRQTLALVELLVDLAEDDTAVPLAASPPRRSAVPGSAAALTAVVGYLEQHFREPVSRDDVAAATAMSPSSVSRLLRRQLGTSLTEYVLTLRLAAACRDLVDTDEPVAAIAHRCGFANLANFNRQFRRAHGMTPRDYRRAFSVFTNRHG